MPEIEYVYLDDGVATVTLNRPERLNALGVRAKTELGRIWADAESDPRVKSIVLQGAGDKAFCAGSDLKEVHETGEMVSTDTLLAAIPGVATPLTKPVIAALHGHCVGMGMTLAIHCDFRIASPGAKISWPEVKHGMISAVSAIRLPELIGRDAALRLLYLGDAIQPEEALVLGLITAIETDPREAALALARRLASLPEAAVQAHKRLATFVQRRMTADLRQEVLATRAWLESHDSFKEGAARFDRRKDKEASL